MAWVRGKKVALMAMGRSLVCAVLIVTAVIAALLAATDQGHAFGRDRWRIFGPRTIVKPVLPGGHPLTADEITLQNSGVRLRGGARFGVGLVGIAGEIHDDQMALSGFCEAAQRVMNTDEARIEGIAANVHAYGPLDDAEARSRHDLNRAFIGRTLTSLARKIEVYRAVLAQWPGPRGGAAEASLDQIRRMALGCVPDLTLGLESYFGRGGVPYK